MIAGTAEYTPDTLRAIKEMKVSYKEDRDDMRERLHTLYFQHNKRMPPKGSDVLKWFFAHYIFSDEKNMWYEKCQVLN